MFVGSANTVQGGSGMNYQQSWAALDGAVDRWAFGGRTPPDW